MEHSCVVFSGYMVWGFLVVSVCTGFSFFLLHLAADIVPLRENKDLFYHFHLCIYQTIVKQQYISLKFQALIIIHQMHG